jgi:diacylglycerol O-acyltransferase
VALTAIFEPGALATVDGGVDIERIRRHIAARLRLLPRYRQRLMHTPVLSQAVWVDDDAFDLGYHVRHASLPRPGGERQLQRRCAEILERALDRRRPLWELWIIEGLSAGRFAMLAKVHHCMVDGIAGVDILAALLATEPIETLEPIEPWTPRPAPSEGELLADEVRRRARASLDLARSVRQALGAPAQAGRSLGERALAVAHLLRRVGSAPSTPFNQPIGPHRRVDWLAMELATIKEIRIGLGGTINDVVLTTVAGAVGKFLARRGVRLDDEFRTVVPVNVRTADEHGSFGNRVSLWLAALPVGERDARRRHTAVCALTERLKSEKDSLGGELLMQAAEWTTANIINLAAQFINRARRFNLIVTNVPGPQVPFYLLGARMLAGYPHLPLFENQGLGVALFSYAGTLYWGVAADWNQLPDLSELIGELSESFDELRAAAQPLPVRSDSAPPRTTRSRLLTVHRTTALTASAAAAVARDTAARTRARSAADGLRRAIPNPRPATARASQSTGQPGGRR